MRAIAATLIKEKGFRSARYLGNRTFKIDYAISGRLTHAFLFPFNIDAQIVLPFVAVKLRGDHWAQAAPVTKPPKRSTAASR